MNRPRAWDLRHNLTFTDGLYLALAEQLAIPLVTLDIRQGRGGASALNAACDHGVIPLPPEDC